MTQSTMRDLLARWAAVEPERCRLNLNWKPANGDNNYYIAIQTDDSEGWQLVYSDTESNYYFPGKNEALSRIQWAVQQAIVSQGWYLETHYTPVSGHDATVTVPNTRKAKGYGDNPAEALLAAYLQALENKKAG